MSLTSKTAGTMRSRSKYHHNAYRFVYEALKYAQQRLGRGIAQEPEEEDAHISGPELLFGIRDFARERFGLMATTVFRHWGIHETGDFGRIVFEMIEHGEMRKTDRDQLSDFYDVYDFEEAFNRDYEIETSRAFR